MSSVLVNTTVGTAIFHRQLNQLAAIVEDNMLPAGKDVLRTVRPSQGARARRPQNQRRLTSLSLLPEGIAGPDPPAELPRPSPPLPPNQRHFQRYPLRSEGLALQPRQRHRFPLLAASLTP